MLSYAGTSAVSQGPLVMAANAALPVFGCFIVPWICTARSQYAEDQVAARNSELCYMVGLKERLSIIANTALPWVWRRVCFTLKGTSLRIRNGTTEFHPLYYTNSGGLRRLNQTLTATANTVSQQAIATQFVDTMFKGAYGTDFADIITAPIDNQVITLKYDRTTAIGTLNSRGATRVRSLWHPMRHNLRYEGDEDGGTDTTSPFSVSSKMGMGDYYVVDFFKPQSGGSGTDTLSFDPTATLYWHER